MPDRRRPGRQPELHLASGRVSGDLDLTVAAEDPSLHLGPEQPDAM